MNSRRTFTAEEKLRIVLEGMRNGVNVADICRRYGIHSGQYSKWKEQALCGAKQGLQPKARGKSWQKRQQDQEMEQLRQIVSELLVENRLLRKKGL